MSESDYYPIFLVPAEILNILEGGKVYPERPHKPQPPEKPVSEQKDPAGCLLIVIVFVLVAVIPMLLIHSVGTSEIVGGIAFIIGLVISVVIVRRSNNSATAFEETMKEYQNSLIKYQNEVASYNNVLAEYDDLVAKISSMSIQEYRVNRIRGFLSTPPIWEHSFYEKDKQIKKGPAEDFFVNWLINNQHEFDVIIDAVVPKDPNEYFNIATYGYSNLYYPDIVLIHKDTNAHFDIEIDEPYDLGTHRPIHYYIKGTNIGSDTERNSFFIQQGWFVFRFTERQVIIHPECCYYAIYSSIIHLMANHEVRFVFSDLFYDDRWTREESVIMAKSNYRDKFLSRIGVFPTYSPRVHDDDLPF